MALAVFLPETVQIENTTNGSFSKQAYFCKTPMETFSPVHRLHVAVTRSRDAAGATTLHPQTVAKDGRSGQRSRQIW